ncbi:hypothetical protein [Mucilaginibacter sp. UYCu711]|uniref:hypothetical protein n=1 Tax=Mucilaginibacter sp. UYCu711 TaxID=3156339 RepID=UPI003D1E63A8
MATIKISSQHNWTTETAHQTTNGTWAKWLKLTDGQAERKTLWFMVSLIFQGVLFLPLPAVLIYYFNAPTLILAVTLSLFFANIITGMSGSGIRTILNLFAVSFLAHLIMLAIFAL